MTRDAFTQYADAAGREDDRSLAELLEDASNVQLRETIKYLYAHVDELKQEQAREYLTE